MLRLQLLLVATAATAIALWATVDARGVSLTAFLAASVAVTTALPLTSRWPTLGMLARVPIAAGAATVFAVALAAAAVVAAAAWAVALAAALATEVADALRPVGGGGPLPAGGGGGGATPAPAPWVHALDDYRAVVDAAGRSLWSTGGAHPAELALLLCRVEDVGGCRGWRTGDCHARRAAAAAGADGARPPPRHERPCPTNCSARLDAAGWRRRSVGAPPSGPPPVPRGALLPPALDAADRGAVDGGGAAAAVAAVAATTGGGCLDVALTWAPDVRSAGGFLGSVWGVLTVVAAVAASSGILSLVLCVRVS